MTKFKRDFTEEEKVKIVQEVLEVGSTNLIAIKHSINRSQLSRWVNNYRRYGKTIKPKDEKELKEVIPNYKKEYEKQKKLLKEKELEIEVLRDLLKKKK